MLMLLAGSGFLLGLWELYQLRFEAGDIYPAYSSLRADPLGTKALYESLRQMPGLSVDRNYLPLPKLAKRRAAIFLLGEDPFLFEHVTEDRLKELETIAAGGARVVVAMRPVRRLDPSQDETKQAKESKQTPIEKRWGITFGYITRSSGEAGEMFGGITKLTALYFRTGGQVMREVERKFGAGSIVLLANCYPFSNEALASERDTRMLANALGDRTAVIFDENHLGLRESGGVATLARKYRLQGVVLALFVLLALFIWKNSTSLVPPLPERDRMEDGIEAKDAGSGLANLLRRNVPAKDLMKLCMREWEASRHGDKFYPSGRIAQARVRAGQAADPAEAYREIAAVLHRRAEL